MEEDPDNKIIIEIDEDFNPRRRYDYVSKEVKRIRQEEGERYLKTLDENDSEIKRVKFENDADYRDKAERQSDFFGSIAFIVALLICIFPEPVGLSPGQMLYITVVALFAFGVGTTVSKN